MTSITIKIEVEGWEEQDKGSYNFAEFTALYHSANYMYIFQKASKNYFSKMNV